MFPARSMEGSELFDLTAQVGQRRWLWRERPFPHIVARDVLRYDVYRSLEVAFQAILSRGFGSPPDPHRFTRNMSDYDAYALNFSPEIPEPFHLFLSRPWHDMLAGLLRIDATGDVNGGLHHHSINSAGGAPHNDLNPGWFVGDNDAGAVNLSLHDLCDYKYGVTRGGGVEPRQTVRAATMIFYLNNFGWRPGNGGETGLYNSGEDDVNSPAVAVPPVNNSLLVFECTPYSYHAFISNRCYPRNSVIMWLHRRADEVASRWGSESIMHWPNR